MIVINIPIITVVIVKLFAKILIARSPKKYDSKATIENLKPRPKIEPIMKINNGTPVAPDERAINL